MKYVNLTPHAIHVIREDGILEIPASGKVARCAMEIVKVGETDDGIPITENTYGDVTDLPDPELDTAYIVSVLVAQACTDRRDLFIPNELVRDDEGRIVGCKSLAIVK